MTSPEQQRDLQLLLLDAFSPRDIQLGRIVADPVNPLLNFIDPDIPAQKLSQAVTTKAVSNVKTCNSSTKRTSLRGALVRLFSSAKATTKEREETFQGSRMETVQLRNYAPLFEEIIVQVQVQKWIEKLCKTSVQSYTQMLPGFTTTVYMIVGYSAVKDLKVQVSSSKEAALSGTIDIATAITSTTGLPKIAPVVCSTAISNVTRSAASATIPGDTIWAIAYQKIKIRTKSMEPSLVSSSQWKIMLPHKHSTDVIAGPMGNYDLLDKPVPGVTGELDDERGDFMRILRELTEVKDREVVIVAELAPELDPQGSARRLSQVEASLALWEMQGRQIPHTHDGEFIIPSHPEVGSSKGCQCVVWFDRPGEGPSAGKQLPNSHKCRISHRRLRHLPIISRVSITGNIATFKNQVGRPQENLANRRISS